MKSCKIYWQQKILSEFGYIDDFVIDFGCGSDHHTKVFESRCKGIIAVDITDIFDRSLFAGKSN